MSTITSADAAKAVVRRNTEEVQGKGNFDLFEELFADDFVDHTIQPNMTPDKAGVRKLYGYMREAFPDFHAEIHWQLADGDRVTTYKTYYGTHEGQFLGVAPTHRKIHFESVDVMRVQNGRITDHWGVGNLLSLMQQIGGWTPPQSVEVNSRKKCERDRRLTKPVAALAPSFVPQARAYGAASCDLRFTMEAAEGQRSEDRGGESKMLIRSAPIGSTIGKTDR